MHPYIYNGDLKPYLRATGAAGALPRLPLLILPSRLVSLLATPTLLYRDAVASSPETLPLLDLGDTAVES